MTALLYGLNLGIDYAISYKLQHSVDRRYIGWSKIINEQLDADLVIMGSSRAWVQYDPAILDSILQINTFNMGIDGSGLNRQIIRYEVFDYYQAKKPKYIVLNVDYFSANEWSYGYEREQFFPYMWSPYMRKVISKVEPMSWGERYIPVYRYTTYKGLYNVVHEKPWDAKTYKGYMGHDKTWNAAAYEELTAFLKSGEKPVLLALGAMSFEDKAETDKLDMFVKAFQKAGCRAIIQGFQKSLEEYKLPETMMSVGSVPHSWLFKQCSFVIHHCGFGTSAATMIYGIPSIPVPHVLDQMGFAMQLRNLNVATEPLKAKELTEENIYNSIVQMQDTYDEKSKNAMEISDKIRTEGGLSEAVQLIESVL